MTDIIIKRNIGEKDKKNRNIQLSVKRDNKDKNRNNQ